ncbi:MAG: hypothetical protein SFY56_08350 [Bacteroidota bacterium]|nr:hypothetical protein [Bacteroidota bacterium]
MGNIDLKKASVSLMEDGIIHIHIKDQSEIELSDAVLIFEAMEKLCGGEKHPVLIDAGEFSSIDKEARMFAASMESNIFTLADGIAYLNLAQKLLAEFYLKNNKPVVPTKVFSNRQDAIVWLNEIAQKVN